MGDDKWKIIDTHLHSMMHWTNTLNANTSTAAQGNARGGHIHRRSEPDVVMIRKAQLSRKNDDVPQSAPVQPGTFALDWSNPVKKLPSSDDVPTEDALNEIITETKNLIDIRHTENPNSPSVWLDTNASDVRGVSFPNRVEEPMRLSGHSRTSTGSESSFKSGHSRTSTGSESSFKSIETPPRPPPYSRFGPNGHQSSIRPIRSHETMSSNFPVPLSIASETSPYNNNQHVLKPSVKGPPPVVNHYGFASPRTSRRSSAPGNQIDPRAHSASPNITRRSTSHSAAISQHRRKTQDNFALIIPSTVSIQNSEIEPVNNHLQSSNMDHSTLLSSQFEPIPDQQTSVMCDDQEYTKVLLQHQHERMQRLQKEFKAKKELLNSLSMTVSQMETEVFYHRNEKFSTCMPKLNDVTKLRAVNRQMEIDCNCMIKEVEMVSKRGNSVGGNFYENINRRSSSGRSMKDKQSILSDLPSPPLPPPPVPPPLEHEEETKWSCKWCTFLNHAALNKCEMCEYRRERTTGAS